MRENMSINIEFMFVILVFTIIHSPKNMSSTQNKII
jgi:hypothetical protein